VQTHESFGAVDPAGPSRSSGDRKGPISRCSAPGSSASSIAFHAPPGWRQPARARITATAECGSIPLIKSTYAAAKLADVPRL